MTALGVPCAAIVRVAVESEARHLCPFKDEVDHGTVRIEWTTSRGQTIELHALAAAVNDHAAEEVSHEQWTAELAERISSSAQVGGLSVRSTWSTAGFTVEVSAPLFTDEEAERG